MGSVDSSGSDTSGSRSRRRLLPWTQVPKGSHHKERVPSHATSISSTKPPREARNGCIHSPFGIGEVEWPPGAGRRGAWHGGGRVSVPQVDPARAVPQGV